MKKRKGIKKREMVVLAIGVIFIVFGVAALINTIIQGNPTQILWICYSSLILLGIGILMRNSLLVVSQLNIITIPLLIWTADFIFFIINKQSFFGIVNYFFMPGPILSKIITTQHLFTIPLALIAVYIIKVKTKYAWIVSLAQVSFLFLITIMLTAPVNNINCVYSSCVNFNFKHHQVMWFVITFTIICCTNLVLSQIKALKNKF